MRTRVRYLLAVVAALVLLAAAPATWAQAPSDPTATALAQAAALTKEHRYREAKLILSAAQRDVGDTDGRLGVALEKVDRQFIDGWASLENIPQQPYLVWIYGLVPLMIGAVAVAGAIVINRRRRRPMQWRFTAYAAAVAAAVLGPFYVGSAAFYANPLPFYFRDWEYYLWERVLYLVPAADWHRPAKGELSRRFLLMCQNEEKVTFTKVKHRFRMSPEISSHAKIVVSGDSLGHGMNVSDHETAMWALSEALGVQVYSDRKPATVVLNYPLLQENPIYLELYAEKRFLLDLPPLEPDPYVPSQRPKPDLKQTIANATQLQTHSRYMLPQIALRAAKRLSGDIRYWAFGDENGAFFKTAVAWEPFGSLDRYADQIAKRARRAEQLGYTYVAVMVPEPSAFWGETTNARYWNLHRYFIQRAAQRGVHVVDLIPAFAAAGGHTLYQLGDGHWNGKGATLAGKVAADYIRRHNLLAPQAEQIAPDATEPDYEKDYVAYLDRYFRPDLPYAQRTCLRPLSTFFN